MSSPSPAAPDPRDGYGEAIAAELERHGILMLSGEDFQRIQAWYAAGVPEWLAVETIGKIQARLSRCTSCGHRAEAHSAPTHPTGCTDCRHAGAPVCHGYNPSPYSRRRPLRYYEPAVLEAAENLREMEAPGARQLPEPCETFTLHAAPGRPCLNCGWPHESEET